MIESTVALATLLVMILFGCFVEWNPTPLAMWEDWQKHKKEMGLDG